MGAVVGGMTASSDLKLPAARAPADPNFEVVEREVETRLGREDVMHTCSPSIEGAPPCCATELSRHHRRGIPTESSCVLATDSSIERLACELVDHSGQS